MLEQSQRTPFTHPRRLVIVIVAICVSPQTCACSFLDAIEFHSVSLAFERTPPHIPYRSADDDADDDVDDGRVAYARAARAPNSMMAPCQQRQRYVRVCTCGFMVTLVSEQRCALLPPFTSAHTTTTPYTQTHTWCPLLCWPLMLMR